MPGTLQRRLRVLFATATTAVLCWMWIPGSAIDRTAFDVVARGSSNPPFFISGNGSHRQPWKLRTFSTRLHSVPSDGPVIVSLGDDLEGVFQSSPPSPIDFAVIFTNMQRLGERTAAVAAVLAWDAPDPMGLMALDTAIGRFDSLLMTAPLGRGAVPEPMPPAFRKASIPVAAIHGDARLLPVVNRIPISGTILGKGNTLAGFQFLDAEPPNDRTPLIARWGDRVVFSFQLLAALQKLDLPPEGVEIRMGQYASLGPDGPFVPLDRYGRLSTRVSHVSESPRIAAEALINGGEDLLPKKAPRPVMLRDDRSSADPATRSFSRDLPALVSAISSDTGLSSTREYPRPGPIQELFLLSLIAIALTFISGSPSFARNVGFIIVLGVCLATQFAVAGLAAVWLPGLSALASIMVAYLTSVHSGKIRPIPTVAPAASSSLPVSPPAKVHHPQDSSRPDPARSPAPRKRGKKRRK